jgi:hypothetical protein
MFDFENQSFLTRCHLRQVLSWPKQVGKGFYSCTRPVEADESSDIEEFDVLASMTAEFGSSQTGTEPLALESLFEICSTVILNSVNLTSSLEAETPFT